MPEPLRIPIIIDKTQLEELRKSLQGLFGDLAQVSRQGEGATQLEELRKSLQGLFGDLAQVSQQGEGASENVMAQARSIQHLTASTIGATRGLAAMFSTLGNIASLVPGVGSLVLPLQKIGFTLAIIRSAGLDIATASDGASAFARALNSIKVPLLIAAGAALGGIIASIRQAISVEENLVRLRLAAGRALNMRDIGARSTALAGETATTVAQAVEAAQSLVKAGVSAERAFGSAGKTVLQFARVAGINAGRATEYLVNVATQMQVSFQEAADVIVRTADVSVAGIEDVAEAFSAAGFAARSLGLSIQDMGTIMSILANAGIRGSMAANSFRRFTIALQEMQSGVLTARQQDVVKQLGLEKTIKALQDGRINAIQFLQELQKANPQMGQLAAMFDVFGARAASALLDGLDKFKQLRGEIDASRGALENYDRTLRQTVSGAFKEFISTLSQLAQRIGEIFAAPLVPILQGVTGALKYIVNLFPQGQRNVDVSVTVREIITGKISAGQIVTGAGAQDIEKIVPGFNKAKEFLDRHLARAVREGSLGNIPFREVLPFTEFMRRLERQSDEVIGQVLGTLAKDMSDEQIMLMSQFFKNVVKGMPTLAQAWEQTAREVWNFRFPPLGTPISQLTEIFSLRQTLAQDIAKRWAEQLQALGITPDQGALATLSSNFVNKLIELFYPQFQSMSFDEQRRAILDLTNRFGYLDIATANLILAFEQAKRDIVNVIGSLADELIQAPRDIQSTIETLIGRGWSFMAQKAGEWARDVSATVLSGVIGDLAGPMGSVIGSLVAGGVVSLGQMLVNALVGIFRGPGRGMTLRGGEIGYHGGTVVRTGQGLATIPLYQVGPSTFAPSVNIGSINVKGDSDHHKLANRLADVISRRVSQTLEANYWKVTLRREGMQEVF